jgi:hypothetical protein
METEQASLPLTAGRHGGHDGPEAGRRHQGHLETGRFAVDGAVRHDARRGETRGRRWWWRLLVAYAVGLLVLVSAVGAAFELHSQLGRTNRSLTSTRAELRRTLEQVATTSGALASIAGQSTAAGQSLEMETAQLGADQQQLAAAEANIHANGVSIADLDTCLSGVERALNQISLGNKSGAAATLNGVASSCRNAQPSG